MPFTLRNIKQDLEDIGSRFDGAPDLEFRAGDEALELEQSALSYQRVPPGYRFPYGHTHKKQEEVYVVVRGSGRMKLDDEIVELGHGTRCACRPVRGEATRPGRRASRSSSSAHPTSARIRVATSTAGGTGGLTTHCGGLSEGEARFRSRPRRPATAGRPKAIAHRRLSASAAPDRLRPGRRPICRRSPGWGGRRTQPGSCRR